MRDMLGQFVRFVAIDFETANANLRSICQVGLVTFQDGEIASTFSSLVDPDDFFDSMNISIHGIDEDAVRGAPLFAEVYPEILARAEGAIVVCHTAFDRVALHRATEATSLPTLPCRWLDTTRVVRRAWPQYARYGYGLANLTKDFGIEFAHHDAAEDARATGLILLRALKQSGLSLEEWLVRAQGSLDGSPKGRITRAGNPDGLLSGETVIFTGALSMPRREAADIAAAAGCEVEAGVTKETTLLVVGDQDVARLAPGANQEFKAREGRIVD